MGDDFLVAISVAVLATVLICTIEIMVGARTNELGVATRHVSFAIYLAISLIGYFTTTVAATAATRAVWAVEPSPGQSKPAEPNAPPPLAEALPKAGFPLWVRGFLAGVLGVFAFKVFLEQINVTFAGRGVLTIEEWVGKARDGALAAAIANGVTAKITRTTKQAQALDAKAALTETQLNTYVDAWLGAGKAVQFDQQAAANPTNARLLKAWSLADAQYDRAATLV